MGFLAIFRRRSAPPADAPAAVSEAVTPRPRPGRLGRLVAATLRLALVPVVAIGLPLWPVLLILTPLPVFCVVALPLLLLDTLLVSYAIAWLVYLALAQTDPPPSSAPSGRSWLRSAIAAIANAVPILPYSPTRVAKITLITLQSVSQVVHVFFPAIFDWSYRRVMVLGTQSGSEIVMENIVYSDEGQMLDAYTPPPPPPQHDGSSPDIQLAPIIVILPTSIPLIRRASGRKTYLQLALRFRRQGYAVVVPEITFYPQGRVAAGVADVRQVLAWIGSEAPSFGGDVNRIYLLGHGMSAHLALLTTVQHAVVHSREKFLDQAWEQEQEALRTRPYQEQGSPASETEKHHVLGDFTFPGDSLSSPGAISELSSRLPDSLSQAGGNALQDELRQAKLQHHASFTSTLDGQRWMDETESDYAGSISAEADVLAGPSGVGNRPPGIVSAGREDLSGLGQLAPKKYEVRIPASFSEAEEQIGMGLKSVELYAHDVVIPPVRGLILMAGISDVIKAYRYERERGVENVSALRRAMGPSHTKCLLHSPAHLLYAAKNILDTDLLPPKFLLVQGGKDSVVPVEQSTLLRTMLQGIGVEEVTMRAYRNLGHVETFAAGFLGMGKQMTAYRDPILNDIFTFVASDETALTPTAQ